MAMIEIRDVSKWYGTFQVLAECTSQVEKGEVVVICGPSGSGKSTLIKCVNGLEPFQKGGPLRGAAAAGGGRAGPRDGPDLHALRRADVGPRPRDDRGGLSCDAGPGQGRDDHDGGDPRDGVRE